MKVTRKMLEAQVVFLNKNLNRPSEPWKRVDGKLVANLGNFHLGISSPGDGWTRYSLHEMLTESGGVHSHFSGNNQDIWAFLEGVDAAMRLKSFPVTER